MILTAYLDDEVIEESGFYIEVRLEELRHFLNMLVNNNHMAEKCVIETYKAIYPLCVTMTLQKIIYSLDEDDFIIDSRILPIQDYEADDLDVYVLHGDINIFDILKFFNYF